MKRPHLDVISEALVSIEGCVDTLSQTTTNIEQYQAAINTLVKNYTDYNKDLNQRVFNLRSILMTIEEEYGEDEAITGIRDRINRIAKSMRRSNDGGSGNDTPVDTGTAEEA